MLPGMRGFLVAFVFLLGCKQDAKKPVDTGPACPEVVDHMLVVMKQGLTGHDGVQLGNRQQMIDQCEQRKMSADERTCLRAAKTLAELASCRKPAAGSGSAAGSAG